MSKQDAKNEALLKRLARENKCAVCETLGPQYVVIDFSTFVCTVCSGVHRHFGHRCKGITMATFRPEEMQAIQEAGGNTRALEPYLARWTPTQLPRPTDRSVVKVGDWILAVFVKKRFYSKEAASSKPDNFSGRLSSHGSHASARSSLTQDGDIPVQHLAATFLGTNGPHLVAGRPDEQRRSATGEGRRSPGSRGSASAAPVSAPAAAGPSGNSSGGAARPLGQAAPSDTWSAFDEEQVDQPPLPPPGPGSDQGSWAHFGSPTRSGGSSAPQQPAGQEWAAFPDPASKPAAEASAGAAPAPALPPAAAQPPAAEWEAFGGPSAEPAPAAPEAPARKELPMDLFSELAPPGGPAGPSPARPAAPLGFMPVQPPYPAHAQQPLANGLGPAARSAAPPQAPPSYGQAYGQQLGPSARHDTASSSAPDPFAVSAGADGGPPAQPDFFSGLVPGLRSALPASAGFTAPSSAQSAGLPGYAPQAAQPAQPPSSGNPFA